MGVTRFVVSKWVKRLRGLGVEIKGHMGAGYQLMKIPDILVPSLIHGELGGSEIVDAINHHLQIDSTNTAAMVLRRQARRTERWWWRKNRRLVAARWPRVVLGKIQRDISLRDTSPALLTGGGSHSYPDGRRGGSTGRQRSTGLERSIRWPNDLLVNGKKVAGILTEMNAELGRLHAVVLGIGINVNHSEMPAELKQIATSLRIESQRPWSRVQICVALLKELERHYHLLLEKGKRGHRRALGLRLLLCLRQAHPDRERRGRILGHHPRPRPQRCASGAL